MGLFDEQAFQTMDPDRDDEIARNGIRHLRSLENPIPASELKISTRCKLTRRTHADDDADDDDAD